MYCVEQAGNIVADGALGVNKVLEYHYNQEKKTSDLVEKFQFNCALYTEEVLIFIPEELDTSQLKSFEQDVFYRLFEMKLKKGFMKKMLEDEYFEQWI